MKSTAKKIGLIVLSTLTLSSCTTDSPTRLANNVLYRRDVAVSTDAHYARVKSKDVEIYDRHHSPHFAYRMIGVGTVYKKNIFGKKRSDKEIKEQMRALAASIGGDGVIDFIKEKDKVEASIITHQKIVL